uniref:CENP-T/Histone H4 histone fold domain-containing protein n=1 Tax=Dicentrarchus labrax TaxID=13489 RepID=A0A8C4F956_DICLA
MKNVFLSPWIMGQQMFNLKILKKQQPCRKSCLRRRRRRGEEEENRVEAETEEEDYQNEEKEGAVDSQTEEDIEEGGVDSQPEEDVAARSQSEDEEVAADSQMEEDVEEGAVDSQIEEEGAADSQFEEDVAEYQDDPAASSQSEEEDGGLADSQPEDEHDGELREDDEPPSEQLQCDLEHISRRAHLSGDGVVPVTEAGRDLADTTDAAWSDGKSKALSAIESSTKGQMGAFYTEAEPKSDKEGSFHLSIDDLSDNSPEEAAAQDPAEQEEEWEDEENEENEESEEVPSKTPAFVREKRNMFHPDPLASPSVLKNVQTSSTSESLPAAKPKQVRKVRTGPAKKQTGLPKSYLMGVFKHFAKTKVSADVYPVLKETMDKFFERMAEDLETYAVHAKRKTIEVEDAELLLRRQGYVNDKVPVEVLIEKYLRMDQRKLLIPIATSGNVVIPKKRR